MSATRINPQMQRGSVTVTNVGTTEVTRHVAFAEVFASAPTVVACLSVASYNRRLHVSNVTASGFDVVVATNSGSASSSNSVWVNWVAVP